MNRTICPLFVLLVIVLGWLSATAEVCPGSEVPASELPQYDSRLVLSEDEMKAGEETHLPWGFPGRTNLLYQHEFIVSYDSDRRVPLWVAYRLRAEDLANLTRRDAFRTDPRLQPEESATCADYEEPVFDRGHMVPNADMNRSKEAQANTYLFSNMTPQHAKFNRQIWAVLEKQVRNWAQSNGTIYVITGSVFDRNDDQSPDALSEAEWMQPTARVAVPSHFYKILIHRTNEGEFETLTIMLPHTNNNPSNDKAYLKQHIVSIREIEARTGLNFLPGLGPLREQEVETFVAGELWPN